MRKADLKKFFTLQKPKKEFGRPVAVTMPFMRDWKIIVCVFAVGMISLSLLAWQIYLSDKLGGGYLSEEIDSQSATVRTVDKKRLETNILLFEARQADFDQLKTSPHVFDPSI